MASSLKPSIVLLVLVRIRFQEMHRQKLNVVLALAKRRDPDIDDVEPVEQILPESLFLHFLLQVLVGRGENPDIGVDGTGSAQALELLVLKNAQQLHLNRGTDLTDFIEEKCSAVSQFEPAFLASIGAGKRTFFITEQARLREGSRAVRRS